VRQKEDKTQNKTQKTSFGHLALLDKSAQNLFSLKSAKRKTLKDSFSCIMWQKLKPHCGL
jgi:hypothetical protein